MSKRNTEIGELHRKYNLPYSVCRKAYKVGNYDKANAELILMFGLDFIESENEASVDKPE